MDLEENARVRSGLRIPYEMNTRLIMEARDCGISKNALILQILHDWIERKQGDSTKRGLIDDTQGK